MIKSLAFRLGIRLVPFVLLAASAAQAAPVGESRVAHALSAAAVAAAPAGDAARSAAAFKKVAEVLRHPRCMNCHTTTEFPRQSDERHPHAMGVQRGADNHGVVGMRCATCHSDENVDEVPGAPNWGLAPLAMGWEGLTDAQLADAIKDQAKNGHRSLEDLYHHMADDQLVAWAWKPGGSRQPPPVSHEEFAKLVREWIDNGAITPKN